MNVPAGICRLLHAEGIVTFDETGMTGDAFVEHLPDAPDATVMVKSTGGPTADSFHGYDTPTVQVLVRGDGPDPRPARDRAMDIYNVLAGLHATVLLDASGQEEIGVVSCTAIQSAPVSLGRDGNHRHEYSQNYQLEIHNPTTHRV